MYQNIHSEHNVNKHDIKMGNYHYDILIQGNKWVNHKLKQGTEYMQYDSFI